MSLAASALQFVVDFAAGATGGAASYLAIMMAVFVVLLTVNSVLLRVLPASEEESSGSGSGSSSDGDGDAPQDQGVNRNSSVSDTRKRS